MKKLVFALLFINTVLKAQMPDVANDPKWVPVANFTDEFSGTTINTSKWKPQIGFEDIVCAPNYDCVYNDNAVAFKQNAFPNDNVVVDNGVVSLIVNNVPVDITIDCGNSDIGCYTAIQPVTQNVTYTVGALISKHLIRFGYIELKFRLPSAATGGLNTTYAPFGANFWLYNEYATSGTTHSCYSEIDVFEISNGQTLNYTTNSHFAPITDPLCGAGQGGTIHDDNNPNSFYDNISGDEWHTAAVHWSPNRIDYYLDGILIKTNHDYWVGLLDPMQILLDINSPISYSGYTMDNLFIQYPYIYDIDYIRTYQLDDCGIDDKAYCGSYPPSTDADAVQNSIIFGGSGCTGADYPDNDYYFYSNEYILIDENTTLGGGTGTIYLDVNDCY